MAAIVRVKRRRDEDPADSLLVGLQFKKSRTVLHPADSTIDEQNDEIKASFKYAGTVSEKNASSAKCIRTAIGKEKLKTLYKSHEIARTSAQKPRTNISSEARYKVIAKRRATDIENLCDTTNDDTDLVFEGEARKIFCLYDVEKVDPDGNSAELFPSISNEDTSLITCNGVQLVREKITDIAISNTDSDNYVYDLYYVNKSAFDYRTLENVLAIEAYREEAEFRDVPANVEEYFDDDDDENEESNWRNDYPEDPETYRHRYATRCFNNYDHFYGEDESSDDDGEFRADDGKYQDGDGKFDRPDAGYDRDDDTADFDEQFSKMDFTSSIRR